MTGRANRCLAGVSKWPCMSRQQVLRRACPGGNTTGQLETRAFEVLRLHRARPGGTTTAQLESRCPTGTSPVENVVLPQPDRSPRKEVLWKLLWPKTKQTPAMKAP